METQTAQFKLIVPKTFKELAKYVDTDKYSGHPVLKYICVVPADGYAVATDTHKLRRLPIQCDGQFDERTQALIQPDTIKKCVGKEITVTTGEFDKVVERTDAYGRMFQTAIKAHYTEIECAGKTFRTECAQAYPNTNNVIPNATDGQTIELSSDGIKALQMICKLHKQKRKIVISTIAGERFAKICGLFDSDNIGEYQIQLNKPADVTISLTFAADNLFVVLNSCTGRIIVHSYKATIFECTTGNNILMPSDAQTEFDAPKFAPTESIFADDIVAVIEELKTRSLALWADIVEYHTTNGICSLHTGNYTASEIQFPGNFKKSKCGYYCIPGTYVENKPITISHGNIRLTDVLPNHFFSLLAEFEKLSKCEKTDFSVGNVQTITDTVYQPEDGTDDVQAKKVVLNHMLGEWYSLAKNRDFDNIPVYYRLKGNLIFFGKLKESEIKDMDFFTKKVNSYNDVQIETLIRKNASKSTYFAQLAQICGLYDNAV